ncbi:hypothetical protein [Vibrio alginolyticus]|uniref:hypothetical protein n=1 Tax=Vibrio alginolyticus TaxID=663 RepID=UPI001EEF281E|nr:hypothetical protein [Vibrio alginolyticus]ULF81142.1 hypothetical protein K6749_23555 [Vibrio alginolyticus]
MDMNNISPLLELANAKVIRDQKGTWSKGSITYYEAMFEELLEVKAEVDSNVNAIWKMNWERYYGFICV